MLYTAKKKKLNYEDTRDNTKTKILLLKKNWKKEFNNSCFI